MKGKASGFLKALSANRVAKTLQRTSAVGLLQVSNSEQPTNSISKLQHGQAAWFGCFADHSKSKIPSRPLCHTGQHYKTWRAKESNLTILDHPSCPNRSGGVWGWATIVSKLYDLGVFRSLPSFSYPLPWIPWWKTSNPRQHLKSGLNLALRHDWHSTQASRETSDSLNQNDFKPVKICDKTSCLLLLLGMICMAMMAMMAMIVSCVYFMSIMSMTLIWAPLHQNP